MALDSEYADISDMIKTEYSVPLDQWKPGNTYEVKYTVEYKGVSDEATIKVKAF